MSDAASRLGTVLAGKWTLEALLGEGAFGAVYRARHKNGYKAAIKILRSDTTQDRQSALRFEREARLANVVDHPSVVHVLDDGHTEDGFAYLVSELVEGETLEEARQENGGTLPVSDVLHFADVLLSVLEVAHGRGVVHRDIKPANLMRTNDGGLKVLDFGVAREVNNHGDGLTAEGALIGTVGFMAPEQAQGRWDLVDPTTDLWSVAATILKLTTGLDVHEADTAQTRLALAATRPACSIGSRGTKLSAPIISVLDRALAFSKAGRYPDAASFRAALQRATRGEGELRRVTEEPAAVDSARALDAVSNAERRSVVGGAGFSESVEVTPKRERSRTLMFIMLALLAVAAFIAVRPLVAPVRPMPASPAIGSLAEPATAPQSSPSERSEVPSAAAVTASSGAPTPQESARSRPKGERPPAPAVRAWPSQKEQPIPPPTGLPAVSDHDPLDRRL